MTNLEMAAKLREAAEETKAFQAKYSDLIDAMQDLDPAKCPEAVDDLCNNYYLVEFVQEEAILEVIETAASSLELLGDDEDDEDDEDEEMEEEDD